MIKNNVLQLTDIFCFSQKFWLGAVSFRLLFINKNMKTETFTKKTYGYCKCSPLDVIVRFENSNLTSFNWGHRYTFINDTEKLTNIFRCSKCKEVIHDNFVVETSLAT